MATAITWTERAVDRPPASTGSVPGRRAQTTGDAGRPGRITGIDMARGIAMALMVIVHFVNWRQGDGLAFTAAELVSGRAMPLFMLLGGIGVTLMADRSATPARNLAIRAAMLMVLGLVLTEFIDRLAIVLQAYAMLFMLAIGLRRLPSSMLLALVPVTTAVGAVTYQVVGAPRVLTEFDGLFTSSEGAQSLVFDGYYPLFPVGAFFVFGLWLARLDLRSDRVASLLLGIGTVVGAGVWIGSNRVASAFGIQVDVGAEVGDGAFRWGRLLDTQGHSAMPAWTISALGTSAAILGFSLLVAPRAAAIVRPLTVVGSTSLTFYVFQAWVTNIVPDTSETGVGVEWAYAIAVYVSFAVAAMLWSTRYRSGPLERMLRVGSGPTLAARQLRRSRTEQ